MRVSAVVVNWKDDDRTLRCLSGLLTSSEVAHVFVVDNESSGSLRLRLGALSEADIAAVTLIEYPENRGFAAAVNEALRRSLEADFDAVLAINNDAMIEGASVALLAEALDGDPQLALVGPQINHGNGLLESKGGVVLPLLGITSHERRSRSGPPGFITWACVLVKSQALHDVGLLDESFFMYWEDVDFSLRLRDAGWSIAIVDRATAVHEVSTNRARHPVAIKAYHTWSSVTFARLHGSQWRLGNAVWLAGSFAANLLRLRGESLRGLRLGMRLAREGAKPAYRSALRSAQFSE